MAIQLSKPLIYELTRNAKPETKPMNTTKKFKITVHDGTAEHTIEATRIEVTPQALTLINDELTVASFRKWNWWKSVSENEPEQESKDKEISAMAIEIASKCLINKIHSCFDNEKHLIAHLREASNFLWSHHYTRIK